MRHAVSIASCLLSGLCLAVPTPQSAPKPKAAPELTPERFEAALRRIDKEARRLMEERHVPGLMLTIVKDDKVALLKGYGYRNLEKKLPMTPDTITMIASCSKAFTSTLALMAVQDGKLKLSDPVRDYIPYFKLKDPQADALMTVGDLMCHSSGLPRTDVAWPSDQLDTKACIGLMANCEPTFLFRENAQYSNILVATAAVATENAYGMPWPQLLHEKITGPLHMDSTSVDTPAKIDPQRMSIGYWFDPITGSIERESYMEAQSIMGAGAVKSSARDLSNWLRFHLGRGEFEGHRLLDPGLLAQAYRPRQRSGDYLGFGLGWYTDERYATPVIEHGGDLPGFQSLVCLVPAKRLGIAFSDNNDDAGLRAPLLAMILENLVGAPDKKWFRQPAKEAGVYVDPTASHLLRVYDDGALWAVLDQGKAVRLARTGWRTYETADPRNPHYLIAFGKARGSKLPEVHLTIDDQETVYRERAPFHPATTVDALMNRCVQAAGGRENLTKPHNLIARYRADLAQEGLSVEGLLARSNDDLAYMERDYDRDRYLLTNHVGVNGRSGGSTFTNFRVSPLVGSDLIDAQIDAQLCQALNWRRTFKSAEIIARSHLDGEPVYVVRKQPIESPTEVIDFISERTGLVLRREAGNPASVTLFGDYRQVEGIMLPWHITQIDGGYHREDIRVASYEKTDRYPHWAFNPLGSAKTP